MFEAIEIPDDGSVVGAIIRAQRARVRRATYQASILEAACSRQLRRPRAAFCILKEPHKSNVLCYYLGDNLAATILWRQREMSASSLDGACHILKTLSALSRPVAATFTNVREKGGAHMVAQVKNFISESAIERRFEGHTAALGTELRMRARSQHQPDPDLSSEVREREAYSLRRAPRFFCLPLGKVWMYDEFQQSNSPARGPKRAVGCVCVYP